MSNMAAKRRALRERDGDRCFYCARVMKFDPTYRGSARRPWRVHPAEEATVEHLVDRQHGGTNDLGNLVLACKACNNNRNYMSLAEKLASREVPGVHHVAPEKAA